MDRRNFFRQVLSSTAEAVEEHVAERCNENARRWIRPPYAVNEVDFLLACTRCDACLEACPHEVVFKLPLSCGVSVANTPALDINHKACQLCSDWPCVTACQSAALIQPEPTEADGSAPLPKLALASVDHGRCLPYQGPECGACRGSCPVPEALQWDGPRPYINPDHCTGCGLCRQACFLEDKAIGIQSIHKPG